MHTRHGRSPPDFDLSTKPGEIHLSGTSMNHIHQLLKSVFQKAIDYDYIYKNPCVHVVAPRREDPKRGSLTIEEGTRLMGEVDKAEVEAYAQIDEKEARRAYREEHGIAKKCNAFCGLHHIATSRPCASGLRPACAAARSSPCPGRTSTSSAAPYASASPSPTSARSRRPRPRPASAPSPSMLRPRHISPCGRSGGPPSSPRPRQADREDPGVLLRYGRLVPHR